MEEQQRVPGLEKEYEANDDDEQIAIQKYDYTVLDAGVSFFDDYGTKHTNACGWLSIATAIKLLYDIQMLGIHSKRIRRLFEDGALSAKALKSACGVGDPHLRISHENIRHLCELYNLRIVKHWFTTQTDDWDCKQYFGEKYGLEIHLIHCAEHYTVPIDGIKIPYDSIESNVYVKTLNLTNVTVGWSLEEEGLSVEEIECNVRYGLLSGESDMNVGWKMLMSLELSDEEELEIEKRVEKRINKLFNYGKKTRKRTKVKTRK